MARISSICVALALAVTGCATDQTDIGDVTAGKYTFHVFREGPAAAAGVATDIVVKPTAGGMPTSVVGWVGTADGSANAVAADFDSNDGDFDDNLTCPSPMPDGAKYFFIVDGTITASIDLR